MPPKEIDASLFSRDTIDLLRLLETNQVEYMIIGGMAVIFHGHARLTGDVDLFFSNSEENVQKLYKVLFDFWNGNIPDLIQPDELKQPGLVLQYGVPPNRIDLLNTVDGISFSEAWQTKEKVLMNMKGESIGLNFISLELLIRNKKKVNRPRDLDDLEFLTAARDKNKRDNPSR